MRSKEMDMLTSSNRVYRTIVITSRSENIKYSTENTIKNAIRKALPNRTGKDLCSTQYYRLNDKDAQDWSALLTKSELNAVRKQLTEDGFVPIDYPYSYEQYDNYTKSENAQYRRALNMSKEISA